MPQMKVSWTCKVIFTPPMHDGQARWYSIFSTKIKVIPFNVILTNVKSKFCRSIHSIISTYMIIIFLFFLTICPRNSETTNSAGDSFPGFLIIWVSNAIGCFQAVVSNTQLIWICFHDNIFCGREMTWPLSGQFLAPCNTQVEQLTVSCQQLSSMGFL